jgi:hypothetical protein
MIRMLQEQREVGEHLDLRTTGHPAPAGAAFRSRTMNASGLLFFVQREVTGAKDSPDGRDPVSQTSGDALALHLRLRRDAALARLNGRLLELRRDGLYLQWIRGHGPDPIEKGGDLPFIPRPRSTTRPHPKREGSPGEKSSIAGTFALG